MQHLEVSGAVRPIYGSLGVRRLIVDQTNRSVSPTEKGKGFLLTPTGPYGLGRTVAATRV